MPAGARALALLLLVLSASCSSSSSSEPPDAFLRICWPGGGTPTPGAVVELGHGNVEFHPVVDEQDLVLFRGSQGGVHFYLNARMQGMEPGNPANVLEPNPISHFTVFGEAGEVMSVRPCSYTLGYRPSSDDYHEMAFGPLVQLQDQYIRTVFGQRVRIRVEVVDATGRYATDERWVRVVEEHGGMDASPIDASVEDAGVGDAAEPAADADVDAE